MPYALPTQLPEAPIFLSGKDGAEKAFQLQDFVQACRESNEVTVLWAFPVGGSPGTSIWKYARFLVLPLWLVGLGKEEDASKGTYVLVYNHTTHTASFKDSSLGNLVGPPQAGCVAMALVLGGAGFVIGLQSRDTALLAVAAPAMAIIITFRWWVWMRKKRAKVFKASIDPAELGSSIR